MLIYQALSTLAIMTFTSIYQLLQRFLEKRISAKNKTIKD
jgi:hypothetical protein